MKIFLKKAIFINRAPFEKLELDFNENEIAVLSAVNGRGKTTILSHIVDAFYEMAKPHFPREFEGKESKYYRISSPLYNRDLAKSSFVYLRFSTLETEIIDYVDIRNICSEQEYNDAITIENKIAFAELQPTLNTAMNIKKVSSNFDTQTAKRVFGNILTYFPSYRYETPGYLNNPYKIKLDFSKETGLSGYLRNPIEVVSGLTQLVNWVMDIVLDLRNEVSGIKANSVFDNINSIITQTLISKKYGDVRFGVGDRNLGGTRIQLLKKNNPQQIYPSIFNLSSGELAIFCLFGEILRQADNNLPNTLLEDITGIVIVDEVDKHLHIKLQKEALPKLFNLFPNVQFIISSHSPFLSMGLADEAKDRAKIIDLDTFGISKDPTTNELYQEVYNMMVGENERFREMHVALEKKIQEGKKTLIITEGKTDISHLRKAKEILGIAECDIEFFIDDESFGDSKLKALLENLSKIKNERKIIGIFDRDVEKIVTDIEADGKPFKNYGNNVFAFCIPIPTHRKGYNNISIEFYYTDQELKKKKDNKCLYFENELNFDSKRTPISSILIPNDNKDKKIWDSNIGHLNWIHSKTAFARLVEEDKNFNFNEFTFIFDKIKLILTYTPHNSDTCHAETFHEVATQ